MDRESQNIQKSLLTSRVIHDNSRVYFLKVTTNVDRDLPILFDNLNNKMNESRVPGNTRECGQTLRFAIFVFTVLKNNIFHDECPSSDVEKAHPTQ